MQNKGFVKVLAVALTVICLFYLSFTFRTRGIEKRAAESPMGEQAYLDSVMNEKVWLGIYSYKECREMQIGLGLDLKGGMNVILEVSVPDVVKALANNTTDANFNAALAAAKKISVSSQENFVDIFASQYNQIVPNGKLNAFFATSQLKDRINVQSSNETVIEVVKEEVENAIDNSFNVLRTRIDRFGVAQPNIQELEGKQGRIMVELPGIKEPERVRKLLQGSANLEFWETYDYSELADALYAIDRRLAEIASTEDTAKEVPATEENTTEETEEAESDLAALLGNGENSNLTATQLEELKKTNPLLSRLNPTGENRCVLGISHYNDTAAVNKMLTSEDVKTLLPRDLKLAWGVKAIDSKEQYYELYALKVTNKNGQAAMTGEAVSNSSADFDMHGRPSVSMTMNTEGAREWAKLTKQNVNRDIAIVLDGYVYSAPNVENEIIGGNSQITGSFTVEDTQDLANVLESGKMPAPAKIVQEDIVGPSLGQESIRQGFMSFIVAFIVLMIYMCAMYGLVPGMIANGALLCNLFFTLGILTSFQAALTMSGIAGFISDSDFYYYLG